MCRCHDRLMRAHLSIVLALVASGCAVSAGESRGVTRGQLAGTTSLVFTNATSDSMCSLRIQRDGSKSYGDNWLPAGGLASGKSIDLKVKPGTYMATWNTCRQPNQPYFAATLTSETAFTIKDARDAKQLFAYVASNVAPTKYAAPRAYHAMVRFQGQTIDMNNKIDVPVTTVALKPEPQAEDATKRVAAKRVDLGEFVDKKAKPTSS
jgi:hypothetical protein